MSRWTTQDARNLTAPEEVRVATRRRDGSLRSPRIIWVVRSGDRIFIRSTNGRSADWFRGAIATGSGQLLVPGPPTTSRSPRSSTTAPSSSSTPPTGAKYGRYASIVDHLQGEEPRAATLEVHPS